jgi:hypothetical protein
MIYMVLLHCWNTPGGIKHQSIKYLGVFLQEVKVKELTAAQGRALRKTTSGGHVC